MNPSSSMLPIGIGRRRQGYKVTSGIIVRALFPTEHKAPISGSSGFTKVKREDASRCIKGHICKQTIYTCSNSKLEFCEQMVGVFLVALVVMTYWKYRIQMNVKIQHKNLHTNVPFLLLVHIVLATESKNGAS